VLNRKSLSKRGSIKYKMRITAELIEANAQHTINVHGERMLSLRGLKIPQIENLGASNDLYGAIDLSDNQLIKLDKFPPLDRLRLLLVNNNRISRIANDLFSYSLKNLVSLIMTNNSVNRLEHLQPLRHATFLERLSLLNNPVQINLKLPEEKETRDVIKSRADVTEGSDLYRLFVISLVPSLRFLDFQRITQRERERAESLFGGEEGSTVFELVMQQQPQN